MKLMLLPLISIDTLETSVSTLAAAFAAAEYPIASVELSEPHYRDANARRAIRAPCSLSSRRSQYFRMEFLQEPF